MTLKNGKLRGGEALIVAEGRFPSSRSSPLAPLFIKSAAVVGAGGGGLEVWFTAFGLLNFLWDRGDFTQWVPNDLFFKFIFLFFILGTNLQNDGFIVMA